MKKPSSSNDSCLDVFALNKNDNLIEIMDEYDNKNTIKGFEEFMQVINGQ